MSEDVRVSSGLATYIAQKRVQVGLINGLPVSIPQAIYTRWADRVLDNRWQRHGEEGARRYLARFGRRIGWKKCVQLARCAEEKGYPNVALGFWKKAYEVEIGGPPPEATDSDPLWREQGATPYITERPSEDRPGSVDVLPAMEPGPVLERREAVDAEAAEDERVREQLLDMVDRVRGSLEASLNQEITEQFEALTEQVAQAARLERLEHSFVEQSTWSTAAPPGGGIVRHTSVHELDPASGDDTLISITAPDGSRYVVPLDLLRNAAEHLDSIEGLAEQRRAPGVGPSSDQPPAAGTEDDEADENVRRVL